MNSAYAIEPTHKVKKSKIDSVLQQYFKVDITQEIMAELKDKLKDVLPVGYKIIIQVDKGEFHHLDVSVNSKYLIDGKFDGYSTISWLGKQYVVLTVYWIYFE